METTPITPSTQKVRRDAVGGKRGDGNRRTRRIRRADARKIRVGRCDPTLTAYAGLATFGAWMRCEGLDDDLRRLFFRLKAGAMVVYPMEAQLRMLIDASFAGEDGSSASKRSPPIACSCTWQAASCRASTRCTATWLGSTTRPSRIWRG
jgi:hypothetical protein